MKKQSKKRKTQFTEKCIVKAHNERPNGIKLQKKGSPFTDLPLFQDAVQLELFK